MVPSLLLYEIGGGGTRTEIFLAMAGENCGAGEVGPVTCEAPFSVKAMSDS